MAFLFYFRPSKVAPYMNEWLMRVRKEIGLTPRLMPVELDTGWGH